MEVLVPEVEKLKGGQVYLEVGVDRGKSLSVARMVAKEGVDVWGVDLQEDPEVEGTNFMRGNSKEMAKLCKFKIDVLFVDADHSYGGCKQDIESWYPKMAKHGVMLFHDADETSPGVVKAVEEFAKENKLTAWFSPDQRCSMARLGL